MNVTRISLEKGFKIKICVVSDLHSRNGDDIIPLLRKESPDAICIPGDLFHAPSLSADDCYSFVRATADVARTFFSPGNHDMPLSEQIRKRLEDSGAVILDDSCEEFKGVLFGGLTSGFRMGRKGTFSKTPPPNIEFIKKFSEAERRKILLCHHPEYYPLLKNEDIDVVLCGHAHGGQIRLFGRGLFAPGQGLFPKYTRGVFDNKMIVCAGAENTVPIPRLFNKTEIISLNVF